MRESEFDEGPSTINPVNSVDGDLGMAATMAYAEATNVDHAHGDIDMIPGRRSSLGSDIGENDQISETTITAVSTEVNVIEAKQKLRVAQLIVMRIDWVLWNNAGSWCDWILGCTNIICHASPVSSASFMFSYSHEDPA